MKVRGCPTVAVVIVTLVAATSWVAGCAGNAPPPANATLASASTSGSPSSPAHVDATILRGRQLVLQNGCGDCHGGYGDPAASGWLAGMMSPEQEFTIGPFKTRARNLTPDNRTGTGRFTERQIFNALRYGLRPGETPDVVITSNVPGQGNFPAHPKYLAPPMPWTAFRHMQDQELMDIAAYVKRAVRPVANLVKDSEGPPDFWASEYTVAKYGAYPVAQFPLAAERIP